MNNNKAPGTDGITGVIYNHAFKMVPTFITAIYNGCLKQGIFPTEWKKARLIPIIKQGKENSYEVSKYRPISLLNIGGKVLEKLMINRTNHHVFITEYINMNQYGIMPQTSTIDAVMVLKDYIEEGFRSEVAVLVYLDVEGAFNSAWWPSILNSLNDSRCPKNLQNMTKSYLSDATNQHHQNRGRNHKRLSPRLVLCTWPVEYLLQFPFQPQLHAPNENHRVRR
jgi:hypothetical protein